MRYSFNCAATVSYTHLDVYKRQLHGWINGYGDGSFHADREINRAEVVTIVNRLLGREADKSYIADNLRKLNTFSDMNGKHWAYYAVMEAANAHTAILGENETWSK